MTVIGTHRPDFGATLGPFLAGLLVVSLVLAGQPAAASLALPCDLIELSRRAGTVFHGRCVERRETATANAIPCTEYTFEVIRAVKGCRDRRGAVLSTVTFRHAGSSTGRVGPDGLVVAPLRLGVPRYKVGDELVLFLTRESRLGLCAPVGLSQGKFAVVRQGSLAFVANPRGRELFGNSRPEAFENLAPEEARALESNRQQIELRCFLGLCGKVKRAGVKR